MFVFYPLLLSAALVSPPDTVTRQPTQHLVKVGLHAFAPADITLGYERQLSDRWAVSGSVGYYGSRSRNGSIYHDYDGSFIEDLYTTQDRFYSLDLQARRYLRPRVARPLGGWYLAANLHTFYRTSRQEHSVYVKQDYDLSSVLAQLELHVGRQWSLGRRFTLDTYAGYSFGQQRLVYRGILGRGPTVGFGAQLGYRFRPLQLR